MIHRLELVVDPAMMDRFHAQKMKTITFKLHLAWPYGCASSQHQ